MATYRVECKGEVREVYLVEADSADEAMRRWSSGELLVSEASSVEPVFAMNEEE